jgi:signal transduction histidine kinase
VPSQKRRLYGYGAVVALYALVFGWWLFFFANQDRFLVRRLARQGVSLAPEVETALSDATDDSMRMFIFEGTFLGLLLVGSVVLVVRSLQREVELHRRQNNFLSAVTHELKSPIASARLYLESLLLGRAEGEKRERYLRHAHADLDRLHATVETLLDSARLSIAAPQVRPVELDLGVETRRILEELARDPALAAAAIDVRADGGVRVAADPDSLRRILRNLLSNAVKYAGPEPRVEVAVGGRDGRATLRVRDFGPGLGDADARRIFEPFVRGRDENVRTRPGVGLGLFLVAELARAHGGEARAEGGLEGGGLAVEVDLPLVRERSAT